MPPVTARDIDRMASGRSEVLCIQEDATVAEAALKMAEKHVGSLIVLRGPDTPAGILTERDILRRLVARGQDPFSVPVSAIMSPEVICCDPRTTIDGLHRMMAKYQIRHVPILEDGVVVGIVTSRDIHAYELEKAQGLASRPIMFAPGSQEGAGENELRTRT